ncbi:hypothetical protein BV898_00031 [Hypsibius exemplaris]|uniref:Prohormone-1 n=1 Tax=Hypsibius exemplaris TaxID=2072580 RepID=A0A1W0XEL8_HYPEX|nr:hypothetical protein BV898_00031 [Hypsibius exemplaris]
MSDSRWMQCWVGLVCGMVLFRGEGHCQPTGGSSLFQIAANSAEAPPFQVAMNVPVTRGLTSDALLDYILNKQSYQRLYNSVAAPQRQALLQQALRKRNKYRLCSVNAVACFGKR